MKIFITILSLLVVYIATVFINRKICIKAYENEKLTEYLGLFELFICIIPFLNIISFFVYSTMYLSTCRKSNRFRSAIINKFWKIVIEEDEYEENKKVN